MYLFSSRLLLVPLLSLVLLSDHQRSQANCAVQSLQFIATVYISFPDQNIVAFLLDNVAVYDACWHVTG